MSLQTRIEALATRIANYLRDDVAPRLLPTGGTAGQVATRTGGGYAWQTPSGGSVAIQEVQVNFLNPARDRSFVVSAVCASTAKVVAVVSLNMPAGVPMDELEMDPITVSAAVIAENSVRITASSRSPVFGPRNINLIFG